MILVDTSIWIDHLNKGPEEQLLVRLASGSVGSHAFIIGELAMGSLKSRVANLSLMADLPRLPTAGDHEVRLLVEALPLHGSGLSYIDAHLLAATRAAAASDSVRLWTRDKRLRTQAERLGILADLA